MKHIKYSLIATALLLAACQNGEDTQKTGAMQATQSPADITLRATSDIQTPSPIKAASFVPNSVATWLGHIILLDEKGILHRATTDSADTDIVALGKYADVMGLAREKQSGVFLALTPQGQIKAFVQTDDEGNFGPMAVSMGNFSVKRFCATATPSQDFIWARTTEEKSQKFTVETFKDTSVTLNKIAPDDGELDPCTANNALSLTETYAIKPESAGNGLILSSDKKTMRVGITNGLSIGQVENAGFVTVTNANMGSVYNEGLLLVAEKEEGRLVLISRAYALKEIASR